MKKFICLLLALLIPTMAFASTIDLSGLSFDELVELKEQINLAIWECKEWQEVTVPQGVWEVGKDIPAGAWVIRCATASFATITIGSKINESKTGIDYSGFIDMVNVVSPESPAYEEGQSLTEYSVTVKNGDVIEIDYSSVLFTPYTGKPDLGFK